jgi:DNA-binding NtrC family response regulator
MTEPLPLPLTVPGSHTILVVDDVGVVRRIAFRVLSEAGYRVFDAESAAEALEVLTTVKRPIDLAIVDVVMPEMSGVDLTRIIVDRWPNTRVLYMSAHQAEVMVREGLQDPGVMFLAKPFTRDELLQKVREALQRAAKQRDEGHRTCQKPQQ